MSKPRDAEITIVGGGAIGCAVAYHLITSGRSDVQVLESGELAGATSGQAAGLVGQVRASPERTRLAMASVRLFARMREQTGYPVDWRQTGSIRLAMTRERELEFRRMAAVAESVGLPVEFLSTGRLRDLFPPLDTTQVTCALWCPTDGYLQPTSLVTAYAQAARDGGATFATRTTARALTVRDGAVDGVVTDQGEVKTSMVINAAGPWAGHVAAMVGLELPLFPVRHQYFVTRPCSGWHPALPVLRIPDIRLYVRAEIAGILCGGWEAEAVSLPPYKVPVSGDIACPIDWDVLGAFAQDLDTFIPGVCEVEVREVFRGWPVFTPDGRFVVGPVPGLRGFVMAAGCNAHGVSGSAGLAAHLLESLEPDPSPYVRSLSPARFVPRNWSWEEAQHAAQAVYQDYYAGLAWRADPR